MRGDAGFPLRLRFAKRGRIRFISHRDVARAFERAFRIVRLPIAFTAGFSPRPKVSFGLALSLGQESDAEYLDVELTEAVEVEGLIDPLTTALPEGIDVTGAATLRDRAPALQESVTSVAYEIDVGSPDGDGRGAGRGDLTRCVEAALASPLLPTTRRRKGAEVVEDVRPAIRSLEVTDSTMLRLEVGTQPRGVRPGEVVAALDGDLTVRSVLRTHQWIERGGARLEPLEADPRPRVPEAHASTREGTDVRRDQGTRRADDHRPDRFATLTG